MIIQIPNYIPIRLYLIMNNPKISIIIPVYKVEQYIEKCIKGILQQSFTNFEVILIDDGSPDDSIQIAKILVADNPRFIFLEKENGGQGSARNMGIDNARGEYLAFIDSDDYIEPLYLEQMYQKIIDEDADICTCDVNIVINSTVTKVIQNDVQKYLDLNDFLLCNNTVTSFPCDKLFKASMFIGMRFDSTIRTYEDSHFVFRLIYGKKITSVNVPLYNYVQREGSTTNSMNPTYIEDKTAVMDCYISFSKTTNLFEIYQDYILKCYLREYLYLTLVGIARHSTSYTDDIKKISSNINYNYFSWRKIIAFSRKDFKRGLGLLIFKVSPHAFRFFVQKRDIFKK